MVIANFMADSLWLIDYGLWLGNIGTRMNRDFFGCWWGEL